MGARPDRAPSRFDRLTRADALARAKKRTPEAILRANRGSALVAQRASAAEALWANGHAAEALQLAALAYRTAVDELAPTESAPTDPGPTDPGPTDPGPTDPAGPAALDIPEGHVEPAAALDIPEGLADLIEPEEGMPEAEDGEASEPLEPVIETADVVDRRARFRQAGVSDVLIVAGETAFRARRPALDQEVAVVDGKHFKALLKSARKVEAILRARAESPMSIRLSRFRRLTAVVLLLAGLGGAGLVFIKQQAEHSRAAWLSRYYPRTSFAGDPEHGRESEIDFDWGAGSPMMSIPSDHFSARFDSCLEVTEAVTLQVGIGSDDGSRVLIDSIRVADNWRAQAYTWKDGEIELKPGSHHIRVEYFEGGGNARLQLRLRVDGTAFTGELTRPSAPDDGCGELAESQLVDPNQPRTPTTMRADDAEQDSDELDENGDDPTGDDPNGDEDNEDADNDEDAPDDAELDGVEDPLGALINMPTIPAQNVVAPVGTVLSAMNAPQQ